MKNRGRCSIDEEGSAPTGKQDQQPETGTPPPAREAEELLYELRIRQLDLDLRNRDLKDAEEALRESEKRYRTVVQTAMDGFVLLGLQGRILDINEVYCRMTGFTAQELLGMCLSDLAAAESEAETASRIRQVQAKLQDRFESRHRRKDGTVFDIEVTTQYHPAEGGRVFAFIRDISEEKKAEAVMAARLRLVRLAGSHSLADLLQATLDEAEALTGSQVGFFHFLEPDQVTLSLQARSTNTVKNMCRAEGAGLHYPVSQAGVWVDCIFARQPVIHNDYESLPHRRGMPEGHAPVVRELVVPVLRGEAIVALLGVGNKLSVYTPRDIDVVSSLADLAWDIAENKRREEALVESQRRLSTLMANLPGMAYRCSNQPDWPMVFVSEGCAALTGWTPADIMANRPSYGELIVPGDRDGVWKAVQAALKEHEPFELTYQITAANGQVRWVWERGRGVFDAGGELLFLEGFINDITQRKQAEEEREKLQEQLNQARKIESVGRLAGGVAHDFNNMLQAILGNLELALPQVPPGDPLRFNLEEIKRAADRSAALTCQLLAFARRQTVAPRLLDLNEVVHGMLEMLRRLIGENLRLEWRPAAGLWPSLIDPSQVDQVLANLCVNARDSGATSIVIETANCLFDRAYCRRHPGFIKGEFARLAVTDDGCGMDQETLAQIFEPFFTTKPAGAGTGLGLATVYGIVQQNAGFIDVQSRPGAGTTVSIFLPRQALPIQADPEVRFADQAQGGREVILLVEDEPSILSSTALMLKLQGYSVLTACNPAEALAAAENLPGNIDLLFTDVVMPGMNGRDLASRITALRPGLKCLFMSGYTAEVIARHGILDTGLQFIQKPFSRKNLLRKIRQVLDQD